MNGRLLQVGKNLDMNIFNQMLICNTRVTYSLLSVLQ